MKVEFTRRFAGALLASIVALFCTNMRSYSQDPASVPLGIALEGYAYPFSVKFLELEMQGQLVRMAYMDVQPTATSNGRTILLLHGKNFGSYYWAITIKRLIDEGYRVVAPDQVGWGKSSKPDVRYSFQNLASNTAKLLNHLNLNRVIVIG